MTTILLDDSGVLKCMTYVPEPPFKLNPVIQDIALVMKYERDHEQYRVSLQKAKEDAIEFDRPEDKEKISFFIRVNPIGTELKPGLYQVDVEVEIDPDKKVARIKSPQPEESQEELPKEVIDFATWYSGMERPKVINAYKRYVKEVIKKGLF